MLDERGVLASLQFAISISGKNWNKLHRNMLNNNVASMEPYGTPKIISDHELYVPFNFTLSFRLIKQKF